VGRFTQEGLKILGNGHGREDAYGRAACIAQRGTPEEGTWTCEEQARDLAHQLAPVPCAPGEGEHRPVGSEVRSRVGLAEDMRALEEPPGDVPFVAALRLGGITELLLEMRTQPAIHDPLILPCAAYPAGPG
jgi:hypothetical protein